MCESTPNHLVLVYHCKHDERKPHMGRPQTRWRKEAIDSWCAGHIASNDQTL